MSGLSQNEENLHVQYNVLTLSFVLCICLRISKASSKQVVNDWKCHVFDSNGHVWKWRISAHAQSVLAAGQKHHNSSPLASACNMVTNKDLKR